MTIIIARYRYVRKVHRITVHLRSFPPHAMVRPARRVEAGVRADPVERTLSRVVAAEIPRMPNSPIEKIFSWTGSTQLSSRARTDRILSQSLVAEDESPIQKGIPPKGVVTIFQRRVQRIRLTSRTLTGRMKRTPHYLS